MHSCPNTATHSAKRRFKTPTAALFIGKYLNQTLSSALLHAINSRICDHKVCINMLFECMPSGRLRIFMTQSIHILKAGRDAHARTHRNGHANARTQDTSTVPAWEAHIMVEILTIRSTAQSVVSQQVLRTKTGERRLKGGLGDTRTWLLW